MNKGKEVQKDSNRLWKPNGAMKNTGTGSRSQIRWTLEGTTWNTSPKAFREPAGAEMPHKHKEVVPSTANEGLQAGQFRSKPSNHGSKRNPRSWETAIISGSLGGDSWQVLRNSVTKLIESTTQSKDWNPFLRTRSVSARYSRRERSSRPAGTASLEWNLVIKERVESESRNIGYSFIRNNAIDVYVQY